MPSTPSSSASPSTTITPTSANPFNLSISRVVTMDVYLLQSPFAASPEYRFWRPPQRFYIPGHNAGEFHILTGGGLIRDGGTVYMVMTEDVSLLGWSACGDSSSSGRHHSRCQPIAKILQYMNHYDAHNMTVGVIGTMVHFSQELGYGLVRVHPEWYQGDEDAVAAEAVPVDGFDAHVDEPQVTDYVEFATADGEEVTGLVVAPQNFCCAQAGGSSSSRRRVQAMVINTSSYSVRPEDCGTWVRRSVASERPLLLGHIVGFSDDGTYGMLLLPFHRFKDDMRRTLRRKAFNLLG